MRHGLRHSRRARGQRGQVATEYMLVISVLVIAAVAVGYSVSPKIQEGLDGLLGEGKQDTESQRNIPTQIERGYISENP